MTRTERNLHMGSPTKDAPTGTLTYSEAYALTQKGAKITPANYTFFPSVGALVSFFTDTSDDLIIDFQWMNGSGTVLSSWYTTIPFDNEDGEDWRNYAEEIEASNTSPDSDATRLEIRIGVGRGDIGIDEDQVWVRYHFDLT